MNIKPFAITICLFFVSPLVFGAIYELQDESYNIDDLGLTTSLDDEANNSFYEQDFPDSETWINKFEQHYLETVRLLKNKQFEEAEKKINNLLQQHPKEADIYILKATLENFRREPYLVIKSYQKAIALDPDNLKAQLGLATSFLQAGQLAAAKKYASSALVINKEIAHTYMLLAEIATLENNPGEAESLLLIAQKKARDNYQQQIMLAKKLAKLYILQNQPKKVLAIAESLTDRYPGDDSALALLASSQIYNQKTNAAKISLKKLIARDPKNIRHRSLLAKLLANQPENKQQVLNLLNEISAIAPENTQLEIQKIVLLTRLELYSEAFNSVKKVKQFSDDKGLAEILEGEIYLAENKKQPALVAFQKSYKLQANTKALNMVVNILISQGKKSAAINFLNQEVKINPNNFAAHMKLAHIFQQQEKLNDATKHYQAILDEYPDNVIVLNNLAWIYHQNNNPDALELAARAYQIAPKSAGIADTYATILVSQGDRVKGIEIFEKASKLAPEDFDIQYRLANAYASSNQTKQAIQILKTIVETDQTFSEKEMAINLLKKLVR